MPAPPSPADLSEDLFIEDVSIEDAPGQEVNEALSRHFGQAADAEAMAEIRAALRDEALTHPHHDSAAPAPLPEMDESAETDRFADLVRAARNNEVELELELAGKPAARAVNPRLVALLGVLLILAVIVVERHAIMRMIPASAKLFHALHLA